MFRTPPWTSIAHAALFTLAAAPAIAAPLGYERLVQPAAKSITHMGVPVSNIIANNLNPDVFGTEGFRPVDVEIESHVDKINYGDGYWGKVWQTISYVEVENSGPLQEAGWVMTLEESLKVIEFYLESQNARPIDIELYFRQEPDIDGDGTVIVPRHACIWVPNKGFHESAWDFIPPMPEAIFYNELQVKYDQGWRPYDVDFAVDFDGNIFGTALLAPIISMDVLSGTQWMATQWGWLTQTELDAELAAGWQLLDFEKPVKGKADPLISNSKQWDIKPVKFYVLVHPLNPQQFLDTHVEILSGSEDFVHDTNQELSGEARLIDLETQYFKGSCGKNGICEGGSQYYEGAWLFPE